MATHTGEAGAQITDGLSKDPFHRRAARRRWPQWMESCSSTSGHSACVCVIKAQNGHLVSDLHIALWRHHCHIAWPLRCYTMSHKHLLDIYIYAVLRCLATKLTSSCVLQIHKCGREAFISNGGPVTPSLMIISINRTLQMCCNCRA